MNYFYGPYSEALQADVRMLEQAGLLREELRQTQDGSEYYLITALQNPDCLEIRPFREVLYLLNKTDPVVLELAATFQAFKELGLSNEEAIERLRRKKGSKCQNGNEDKALNLLRELHLLE